MRRLAPLLLLLAACAGGPSTGTSSAPGHGAVAISIEPNPLRARQIAGNQYEFPFEVIVRETGGRPIEIERVSAQLFALGGLSVGSESYDAARIRGLGYQTSVGPNGELRYRFAPRRDVPDERLFGNVTAELRVDARDDTGTATRATTTVTVTR